TYKLSEDDAKTCWSIFKGNLEDFALLQEYSGKPAIVSSETALGKLPKPDTYSLPSEPEQRPEIHSIPADPVTVYPQPVSEQPKQSRGSLQPQFTFNIQIHL